MRCVVTFGDEAGQALLDELVAIPVEIGRGIAEHTRQRFRHDEEADADARVHRLAETAEVEHALVAIQSVNSETGVIQPLDAVAAAIRAHGGLWLADAAQSAGKLPLPDADLIIVSAHKLGGPPGIGALLVKDLASIAPTGGQEKGYRGGTENLPAAIGFAAALDARGSREPLVHLRRQLDEGVRRAGGSIVAEQSARLPEIASYRLPGVPAAAQLIELDMAGISVSAGSACSSGTLKPSQVLTAMGWTEEEAREVIRVSIAPQTSLEEVERFLDAWTGLANRRRAA